MTEAEYEAISALATRHGYSLADLARFAMLDLAAESGDSLTIRLSRIPEHENPRRSYG